jgi:hypothetical protein
VESASGGRVQRLVCEFFLDERDKLWLRRTLDCQVLVPEEQENGGGSSGSSSRPRHRQRQRQQRPRTPHCGDEEEEEGDSHDEEEEEEEVPLQQLQPPLLLPGRRMEERVGRRQARREVAVDEAEVARILAGSGAGAGGR